MNQYHLKAWIPFFHQRYELLNYQDKNSQLIYQKGDNSNPTLLYNIDPQTIILRTISMA